MNMRKFLKALGASNENLKRHNNNNLAIIPEGPYVIPVI